MTKVHHQGKSTTSHSQSKFAKRRSMTYFRPEPIDWLAEGARAMRSWAFVVSRTLGPPGGAIAGPTPADDAVVLAVLPTALVRHRDSSREDSSEPRDAAEALQRIRVYLDADAESGDARYLDRAESLL